MVELADLLYTAYRESVGGVAINGDPLPDFADLPCHIQDGWRASASAAEEFFGLEEV